MEQDCAQQLEREKKLLEAQVKDMQTRVDEAQAQALKGGKKAMNKMDTRIRELESEMDAENRRQADAQKNLRLVPALITKYWVLPILVSKTFFGQEVGAQDQGACLPTRRGQDEPQVHAGPNRSASGQNQVLQEVN